MTRLSRWGVLALVALAAVGAIGSGSRRAPRPVHARVASSGLRSCPASVRSLGWLAVVTAGRVELIDLGACRVRAVRAPGAGEVRFSPDGRWLAYSPLVDGSPTGLDVISVQGGPVRTPLGAGVLAWTWSRTAAGPVLYGIARDGSLVSATPNGGRRTVAAHVVPISFGYGEPLPLSPDGQRAAVDRSSCRASIGELDTVDLRTGARTVAVRRPGEFFTLAGWSPDGRWLLFWAATMCSASLDADGWPLYAVPASGGSPVKVVGHMLLYDDFLSWCGSRLIAAAGPDRQTNQGSKLVSVAPPAWHERTLRRAGRLSWVSPACAPAGHVLAAAAGPNSGRASFGIEHRSIWLLRAGSGARVRRLSLPPAADLSDEAPRFSRGGRWILFVRTQVVTAGLATSSRDTLELVRVGGGATIPILDFTSGDFSYYDHFDWPYEIDWHQRQ
jgi:hypothetical protein